MKLRPKVVQRLPKDVHNKVNVEPSELSLYAVSTVGPPLGQYSFLLEDFQSL